MNKKFIGKLLYWLFFGFCSFELAIVFVYNKPFYDQAIAWCLLLAFGIVVHLYVNVHPIILYVLGFCAVVAIFYPIYKHYLSQTEFSDHPQFILPNTPLSENFTVGGNPIIYHDQDFFGIISANNYIVYVFDLSTNELHEKRIGETNYNNIDYLEYMDGRIYVMKNEVQGEGVLYVLDALTLDTLQTKTFDHPELLLKLNDKLYIENQGGLSLLTDTLDVEEVANFQNVPFMGYYFGGYYLFQSEEDYLYTINVYDENFQFVKTLVQNDYIMTISENSKNQLFIDVVANPMKANESVSFQVYDSELNFLKQMPLKGAGTNGNATGFTITEVNGFYYVNQVLLTEPELVFYFLGVYDSAFHLIDNGIATKLSNPLFVNILHDNQDYYLISEHRIYTVTDQDLFKSPLTLTYHTPFNWSSYYILMIYPIYLINFNRKKKIIAE